MRAHVSVDVLEREREERSAEELKAVEIAPEFIVRAAVFNGSAELSVTREELLKHNTTDCQFGLKLQWACKHC